VQGTDAPGFSLGAKPPEDRLTGKAHINAKGRVRIQKRKTENPAAWAGWKDGGDMAGIAEPGRLVYKHSRTAALRLMRRHGANG